MILLGDLEQTLNQLKLDHLGLLVKFCLSKSYLQGVIMLMHILI